MDNIDSAKYAVAITSNVATWTPPRGVYIGAAGDYDFAFLTPNVQTPTVEWILFAGCVAGSILPISPCGARDGDDSALEAGDIVFLY